MTGMWLLLVGLALAGNADVARHLADFEDEAAARGVELPGAERLRVRLVRRLEDSGFCRQENDRPVVLLRRSTWRELDDPPQQALLFHELGHCLLNRAHDNRTHPNGEWTSLMRGGDLPPGRAVWIAFEGERRAQYLDELFSVGDGPQRPHGEAPALGMPGATVATEGLDAQHHPVVLEPLVAEGDAAIAVDVTLGDLGSDGGLVWVSDRAVHLSLTHDRGLVVGVVGEARPWVNWPAKPGLRTLWMWRRGDRLVLGVDQIALFDLALDELGDSPPRVGALRSSGDGAAISDVRVHALE